MIKDFKEYYIIKNKPYKTKQDLEDMYQFEVRLITPRPNKDKPSYFVKNKKKSKG